MSSKAIGNCVSCPNVVMSFTGATTTSEGKYLCGPCSTRLKESVKLKKRPAPSRVQAPRLDYPEPPPVSGARWLQLGSRQLALVDAADFSRASVKNWFLLGGHAVRRELWGSGVRHDYLHRFILGIDPSESEQVVEFIDRNPLNCRRSNLRVEKRTAAH